MRSLRWLVLIVASGATSSLACVDQARHDEAVEELQRVRMVAERTERESLALQWRMAALTQQAMLREAQVSQVTSAVQFVRKLEELTVLNADLAKRLETAEVALQALSRSGNKGAADPRLDAEIEQIKARRLDSERRAVAYRDVLRTVQTLVDSGQVKAILRDGRVRFDLPRQLDTSDPWRGAAP